MLQSQAPQRRECIGEDERGNSHHKNVQKRLCLARQMELEMDNVVIMCAARKPGPRVGAKARRERCLLAMAMMKQASLSPSLSLSLSLSFLSSCGRSWMNEIYGWLFIQSSFIHKRGWLPCLSKTSQVLP